MNNDIKFKCKAICNFKDNEGICTSGLLKFQNNLNEYIECQKNIIFLFGREKLSEKEIELKRKKKEIKNLFNYMK